MIKILSKHLSCSNLKHLTRASKVLNVRETLPRFSKQYLSTKPNVNIPITIRLCGPEDYSNVLRFMRQNYFEYEPTCIYLGLTGSSLPSGLLDLMYLQMKKGYTIAAENEEKRIMGVAICGRTTFEDVDLIRTFMEQIENKAFRSYLGITLDLLRMPNVWELCGVTEFFEGLYIAVDPKYRTLGIGFKLVMEQLLLAQRLNYLVYRADVSNRYSQRVIEKFNVRCVHRVPYKEYMLNGQAIFKNVQEPHTELCVYVKKFAL